jgi:hypothetical protein
MPPLLDARLILDSPALRGERDRVTRSVLREAKNSVADATKGLERDLEAATKAAVPGKLWRAWKSEVFPRGPGIAREPVGTVFVNGGARSVGAITFFTRPGRIKGGHGQFLAIPTPEAGSKGRRRDLTPDEWEARTGLKLRFAMWGGKPALVAEGLINARSGTFRRITKGRTKADERRGYQRGVQTVKIFSLVPNVDFKNAFAVDPMIRRRGRMMADDFERRLRGSNDRRG